MPQELSPSLTALDEVFKHWRIDATGKIADGEMMGFSAPDMVLQFNKTLPNPEREQLQALMRAAKKWKYDGIGNVTEGDIEIMKTFVKKLYPLSLLRGEDSEIAGGLMNALRKVEMEWALHQEQKTKKRGKPR